MASRAVLEALHGPTCRVCRVEVASPGANRGVGRRSAQGPLRRSQRHRTAVQQGQPPLYWYQENTTRTSLVGGQRSYSHSFHSPIAFSEMNINQFQAPRRTRTTAVTAFLAGGCLYLSGECDRKPAAPLAEPPSPPPAGLSFFGHLTPARCSGQSSESVSSK